MKLRDSLAENNSIRLQAEARTWQEAVKLGVDLLVVVRAILDATVGVVDQPLARLSPLQCHLQGLGDLLCLQRVIHAPAYDLA